MLPSGWGRDAPLRCRRSWSCYARVSGPPVLLVAIWARASPWRVMNAHGACSSCLFGFGDSLMNKVAVGVLAGILAGAAGGYLAADRGPLTASIWRLVRAPEAPPQNDPDCFPKVTIASDEDRDVIRKRMDILRSEIPEQEIAILTNLIRDDQAPVPYSGQRAMRSAANLASMLDYQACRKRGASDCSAHRATHLVASQPADRPEVGQVERQIGRWSILTQNDLKRSTFCRLEYVVVGAGD